MPRALPAAAVLFLLFLVPGATPAQRPGAGEGPVYTGDGQLQRPARYREWIYLSTGVDMSYNPKALASPRPAFDNVFVEPDAYRAFQATGRWPDKTQLVLEIRNASTAPSINHRGHSQGREVVGIEMHVKDEARFPGGWAFFDFDDGASAAQPIPSTAACYGCHQSHAAVDTTFAQFYPTLLPIAEQKQTLSAAFLREEADRAQPAR